MKLYLVYILHEKIIVHEGKKTVPAIYSETSKALYRTIDDSMLFFDNIATFLINDIEFMVNLYDIYVVN